MTARVGHIIDSNDSVYKRGGGLGAAELPVTRNQSTLKPVQVGIDFCRKRVHFHVKFKHDLTQMSQSSSPWRSLHNLHLTRRERLVITSCIHYFQSKLGSYCARSLARVAALYLIVVYCMYHIVLAHPVSTLLLYTSRPLQLSPAWPPMNLCDSGRNALVVSDQIPGK